MTLDTLLARVRAARRALPARQRDPEAVVLAVVAWRRAGGAGSRAEPDSWRHGLQDPLFPWGEPLPPIDAPGALDDALAPLLDPTLDWESVPWESLGAVREALMDAGGHARRGLGAHHTPAELADRLVEGALRGLRPGGPADSAEPFAVCDPAMGAGALLMALARALLTRGIPREQVRASLYGVDRDPLAVALGRVALAAMLGGGDGWQHRLRVGDALTGAPAPRPGSGLDWCATFPEVMGRGGFDAVIANPPFGGERVRRSLAVDPRLVWPEVHGKADLAAYFVHRIASILRPEGVFGLLATNTIAQGHTRASGLGELVRRGTLVLGGADVDRPWPGAAKVTVNLVFGARARWTGPILRDGVTVAHLSTALTVESEPVTPRVIPANLGACFEGVKLGSRAFLIPADEAEARLAEDPALDQVLRPYLGGAEITDHPRPTSTRWVIDLDTLGVEACRERWPDLVARVRASGRPGAWWRFARPRPALAEALARARATRPGDAPLRVVVSPRVARHLLMARIDAGPVCSEQLNVFLWADDARFGVLQSVVHEAWARRHSSTLETRLRYTPSTCFWSFPFPEAEAMAAEGVGEAASSFEMKRVEAAEVLGLGLTALYNRLDQAQRGEAPEVTRLREARRALDVAVMRAYGWPEIEDREEMVGRLRGRYSDAGLARGARRRDVVG